MSLQACCVGDAGKNAVFTMTGSNSAHNVTINFLNANRSAFMPVVILADTGSDITLLSREDGERLGFSPTRSGNKFGVGGVGAGAVEFAKFTTYVRVENLKPVQIDFGVAEKYGALRDNLLGREDVLDHYNITFSKGSVTFSPRDQRAQTAMECGMCSKW